MIDKFFIALYSDYFVYYAIFVPIFVIIAVCMLISATRTIKLAKKRLKFLTILIVILSLVTLQQFIPYLYQRAAMTSKDSTRVARNYKKAIKTSMFKAQKALIWIDLGIYYYENSEFELALDAFEKAHEYFKRYDIEKYGILVAKINLKQKNFDKAIEVFKELKASKWVVISYILKEDFDTALKQIDEIIEKEPENSENYITRAIIYMNLKNVRAAKVDYLKAVELTSDKEKCLNYLNQLKEFKTYHKKLYLDAES